MPDHREIAYMGTLTELAPELQMSVNTGSDEKAFVDFSAAVSSLVKILVATDSFWSPPHFLSRV